MLGNVAVLPVQSTLHGETAEQLALRQSQEQQLQQERDFGGGGGGGGGQGVFSAVGRTQKCWECRRGKFEASHNTFKRCLELKHPGPDWSKDPRETKRNGGEARSSTTATTTATATATATATGRRQPPQRNRANRGVPDKSAAGAVAEAAALRPSDERKQCRLLPSWRRGKQARAES